MRNLLSLGLCMLAVSFAAKADVLTTDGGFESGLTGWTMNTTNDPSVSGWFADSTTTTPLNGNPTVGPFAGNGYAVTDQYVPGTNTLSQSFTIASNAATVTLSFELAMNDYAGDADVTVDILTAAGNPLTQTGKLISHDLGTDVIVGGVPNPYVPFVFSLNALPTGHTYILDFVETDSDGYMNASLDNVVINEVVTPEPSSIVLMASLVGLVGLRLRRRLA